MSQSESLPGFGTDSKSVTKLSPSMVKEWVKKQRQAIRPWSDFVNTNKFRKPASVSQWTKRATRNIEHYQTNYIFVFTGLIIYCIVTSPLLLIAIGVFLGACYFIHVKNERQQIKVLGRELTHAHQYGIAAALSFPLFFVAGAGAAVFWVLGVSLVLITLHASFHFTSEEGTAEDEEPFMETV